MTRPYATAAALYRSAGWLGVLPIPAGAKASPPEGWTGASAPWPSGADIQAWLDGPEAAGNVALRLPAGVIGIDVDAYDDKVGGQTWADWQERYGPAPKGPISSSRDGISGIRLFRCDPGLIFPGKLGPDVEIIQERHRYMLVWPSLVAGRLYRWRWLAGSIPLADDCPWLPDAYAEALGRPVGSAVTPMTVEPWPLRPGLCRAARAELERVLSALATGGSRHDSATTGVMALVHLGAEGHGGVTEALATAQQLFVHLVTADGTRSMSQAEAEWRRLVDGAAGIVGGRFGTSAHLGSMLPDPCDNPFAGIWPDWRPPSEAKSGVRSPDEPASEPSGDPYVDEELRRRRVRRDATALFELDPETVAWRREDERRRRVIRREVDEEEAEAEWREPPWRPSLTEELALPDEETIFTVAECLPRGANVLLTAQYKTGKTTLINNLAHALADGLDFLGRFGTQHSGRIALWNYEVTAEMYRRWLRAAGIKNTDEIVVLNLRGYRVPMTTKRGEAWAADWLSTHGVSTWIIDPAARAFAGLDENSNSEVGLWLDTLDVIKAKAGITDLILPTHTGRMAMEIGEERARGATRLDDWADVRWLLTKDDNDQRSFRATGRDVDIPEGSLSFDPITRALRFTADGGRKGRANGEVINDILEILANDPGMSQRAIFAALRARGRQGSDRPWISAIEAAAHPTQRLIVRVDKGRGMGFAHYCPVDAPVDNS